MQKPKLHKLLWMLWFDKKNISSVLYILYVLCILLIETKSLLGQQGRGLWAEEREILESPLQSSTVLSSYQT